MRKWGRCSKIKHQRHNQYTGTLSEFYLKGLVNNFARILVYNHLNNILISLKALVEPFSGY